MRQGKDRARSTTRLPAALQAELGIDTNSHGGGHSKHKKPQRTTIGARKAARKEQRRAKHAARVPTKKRPAPTSTPVHAQTTSAPSKSKAEPARKKARVTEPPIPPAEQRTVMDPITGQMKTTTAPAHKQKGPTKLEKLMQKTGQTTESTSPDITSQRSLSRVEQQEEDEIAWLEHQLYGKKGQKQQEGDDLDFLLDDLDRFHAGMYDDGASEEGEGLPGDLEGDVDLDEEEDDVDLDEDEDDDLDEEDKDEDEEEEEEEDKEDDIDLDEDEEGAEEEKDIGPPASTANDVATPTPATSKYVPPALRKAAEKASTAATSLEHQKLRRHINGQLNRLAEGNLDTIVGELDGLYRSYARGDVTSMITQLVLDTIAARSNLSETIVVLYAALLAAMHRIVGVEFGAYFLQECLQRFLASYAPLLATSDGDVSAWSRECVNLVMLLCHMFNLKLLSSGILLDLVRLLLGDSFTAMIPGWTGPKPIAEIDIELILRMAQSSGQQLRHADPEALKAIVDLTKKCLDGAPASAAQVAQSGRARFMLEALIHLRQKGRHLARDTSSSAESLQRMAKYLSSMEKRRTVRTQAALQVGLQDLQDAESRGRWWLVGAAWTGREAAPSQDTSAPAPAVASALPDDVIGTTQVDVSQLAKAQGMNTDARRMIFSTLLSSLDYKDAAQNLMQLKLSEVQRREVIRVLIHCLAQERTYNPYYVLVGQHLAQDQPGMRVTMQFVLWDYFRDIGEKRVGGESMQGGEDAEADDEDAEDTSAAVLSDVHRMRKLIHVARAYAYWFARGGLSLSALKTVDFTSLHAAGTMFLQHVLLQVLLLSQTKSPILTPRVHTALAKPPTKAQREGLEQLLVKGTVGQPHLAQGLLVFFKMHLQREDMATLLGDTDPAVLDRLCWAADVAHETLSVGATAAEADGTMS